MKLVLFEWKKTFTGKLVWIFLAMFCLNLGAYYIYMIPVMPGAGEEMHQETEYTAEEYHQFIDGLKERAEYMSGISIFNKKGGFSQKNIEKTVKDFERVEDIEIHPMNDMAMRRMHEFYLTDIFMILLVGLFCFQKYGVDFKSGMGNLIHVTPRGKSWLRLAQILSVGLNVLLAGLLFYGTNILLTGRIVGFQNLSHYVQGMSMFRNVSFPCTVGTYLILFIVWKITALMFISLVFQLFAVWFGGQNISWILSGSILVLSFGLWFFLPDSPGAKLFRYLNPIGLLDVRQIIGNYQNLKVFGNPVFILDGAILFMTVAGGLLVTGILFVTRRDTGRIHMELPSIRRKKIWKKVLTYEGYKVIVNQRAWCIFVILVGIAVWSIQPWQSHIGVVDFYYENYFKDYEGEYTEEKVKEIENIKAKQGFGDADQAEGFERIYQQAVYLQKFNAENKGFVNLRVLDEFFLYSQMEIKNMLLIVLAVMLAVSNLFYQDRKNQMEKLLATTPKARAVYWRKIHLAVLFGLGSSAIVWGVTYVKYFLHYDVVGLGFSIRSIPEFEKIGYAGSILSYMVIAFVLRMIVGAFIGLMLGFIAQIFTAPTQNIICAMLLLVVPLCFSYIGEMEYAGNPLIQFINTYLQTVLRPVEILSTFPSVWFRILS